MDFFLRFIFIFIDKPSNKDWVAGPKFLLSVGWWGFSENGKRLSKQNHLPLAARHHETLTTEASHSSPGV